MERRLECGVDVKGVGRGKEKAGMGSLASGRR